MSASGPLPASYWVVDDLLLAGPYPGSHDDDEAAERIGLLLDVGMRLFVDLTEEGELLPYGDVLRAEASARGVQAEHVRAPIRDLGVPTSRDLFETLRAIDAALRERRPVYVHCWGGIGRTGTIVGCWLAQNGHPGAAALARLAELRGSCDPYSRRSPETDTQRATVTGWAAQNPEP